MKRITLNNSSNDPATTLKFITSDGTKEIQKDVKPHEIRHLFVPRVYQDNKSKAGFMNNRRREGINKAVTIPERSEITESSIVYVPPEKFENLDKDVELDPEEEFQVDESNHGLYLLNYSDTENVTQNTNINATVIETKDDNSTVIESSTQSSNISKEESSEKTVAKESEEIPESNIIANSTDSKNTKLIKVDTEKENRTLFMSDEIYNHFRPLETELPVEEMAPFKYFGQKLGGPAISDNLTNSPTLSASTKSVNFIVAPIEKRKFNSRYSATEKYKNTSVDEEEINEDMDVSVVKNVIEKNKVRNTVKGPAPARHVGLVNQYRKFSTTVPSTTKPQNVAQLNVTEPIILHSPSTFDKSKDINKTNSTSINKEVSPKTNTTNTTRENSLSKSNVTSTSPRNFTRNYSNIRRRPLRVTAASTENTPVLTTLIINATTTEKAATSVYTAVVTSVSITSSMKANNKTDGLKEDDKGKLSENVDTNNRTIPKAILMNETETTTILSPSFKPKHIIRIRTTTTENPNPSPNTAAPIASELSTRNTALVKNETESKISDRLANLFRQRNIENTTNSTRVNKHRRRRPTTTTTTTLAPTLPPTDQFAESPISTTQATTAYSSFVSTSLPPATTVAFKPFVVTSRTSSESSSKPVFVASSTAKTDKTVNRTGGEEIEDLSSQNEEVVIEAEKTYTASYVLAGLGFLPVAAIVAFVLRSVLNKKTKEIDTEYEGYFEDGDIKKESPITPVARPPLPTPTKPDQKWEFPRNKLRLQTLLGQGNFGQVSLFDY